MQEKSLSDPESGIHMDEIYNRVVILGAAGFVGYHLAEKISENPNANVILVDNFLRGENDSEFAELIKKSNCTFFPLDLTLRENLVDLIQKDDIVYNLIAFNGTRNFYEQPMSVLNNSGLTAILIADVCAKKKIAKYFYFGSSESYAGSVELGLAPIPTPENVALTVSDVTNVRWSYGASKTIGEVACFAANKEFGLDFLIFRIHNLYGPRMGPDHVVSDLIQKFYRSNPEVFGVKETRSFMFIGDAVEAIMSISSKSNVEDRVINVGSETEITILELAHLIKDKVNPTLVLKHMESLQGSISRRSPDVTLMKKYYPSKLTQLEHGIDKTVSYYLERF